MPKESSLERELRFKINEEHTSLYSWAIIEVDDQGKQVGIDQIPWSWTLSFTATELVLRDSLKVQEASEEGDRLRQQEEVSHRRTITAVLRAGDPRSERDWFRRTTYRMFGTDRDIRDFNLEILPLATEDEKEEATAWAGLQFDTGDFHPETFDDSITFYLMVKPSTFDRYVERIANGTADEVILSVGRVAGFYSEWSPDMFTRDIKVLCAGEDQKIVMPPEATGEVPRVHAVGEANLYINAKRMQTKPTKSADADDDEPDATPLVRPEFALPSTPAIDPKMMGALRTTGRWIIGLLIVLILVTVWKR